jgi:protein-tyrosine phosphatase
MLKLITKYINTTYGSKRGLLRYFGYKVKTACGAYRQYKNIDQRKVKRLVFICKGNICRSSLAEAYGRSLGFNCISCGISCENGFPADDRALQFSSSHSLNLADHRTTHIGNVGFEDTDLLVLMEPDHLPAVEKSHINGAQLTFAGLWLKSKNVYIHDPYSSEYGYFAICADKIGVSTEGIINYVGK